MTTDAQTSNISLDLKELIPGIYNEITFNNIIPKLAWTDFHTLIAVSKGWRKAIQGGRVYDARLRTNSTETLAMFTYNADYLEQDIEDDTEGIALYSMKTKTFYDLPRIPDFQTFGLPWGCQCISLDGKIYILGGEMHVAEEYNGVEAYALNLAEQRPWKRCADMLLPRKDFGCGVINGKIYIFGGIYEGYPVLGSEVYDPKADSWSLIAPMKSMRCDTWVTTFGEELFLYGGSIFTLNIFKWLETEGRFVDEATGNPDDGYPSDCIQEALLLEVYHPAKNEWRVVEPIFVAKDKKTDWRTQPGPFINENKLCKNLWTDLHPFPFSTVGPTVSGYYDQPPAIHVHDELIAVSRDWFIESKGYSMEDKDIVWDCVKCPLSLRLFRPQPFLCPIYL